MQFKYCSKVFSFTASGCRRCRACSRFLFLFCARGAAGGGRDKSPDWLCERLRTSNHVISGCGTLDCSSAVTQQFVPLDSTRGEKCRLMVEQELLTEWEEPAGSRWARGTAPAGLEGGGSGSRLLCLVHHLGDHLMHVM